MSVRLVHPPRPQAGTSAAPNGFPPAANDDSIGGLWFPSTSRDNLIVAGLVLLLILAAVLLALYGDGAKGSWLALWGATK
ncbi:hypothetical protein ABL840_26920 [Variovorax sp. NFACC27]|uniref:hypothetical protein n=1 Tax=unclassified Variovorax TaxID=663243 RepID=UPI00089BF592|nr:hypothetical protein SAMN03159371_03665 [Variovorax sp. NFACC28]SEG77870.1 hypothetical protein SAMN03159365_03744 [Variovorax sp. NFACC29]SFC96623.1 hypothetical protein SAMN03159379_03678 [Variovorax sp. NFACC26]SFG09607.1 hypothetical protein SAMN03159447_01787 [Variovorax sp. NFACC27]